MQQSQAVTTDSSYTAQQIADMLAVVMWADNVVTDGIESISSCRSRIRLEHGSQPGIAAGLAPTDRGCPSRARPARRRPVVGRICCLAEPATRGDEGPVVIITGPAMNAKSGPGWYVDLFDGSDIDTRPDRSLSVTQLQQALRAAHQGVYRPSVHDRRDRAASDHGEGTDPPSKDDRVITTPTSSPAGVRAVLSSWSGLNNLGQLLASRRDRGSGGRGPVPRKRLARGNSRAQSDPAPFLCWPGGGLCSQSR